jgi:hypothetical protein
MAVAGQEQPTALVAELDDLLGELDEINWLFAVEGVASSVASLTG